MDNVAVYHLSYMWYIHIGELAFNTSVIWCGTWQMVLEQHERLGSLYTAYLHQLDCAFVVSHLKYAPAFRQ